MGQVQNVQARCPRSRNYMTLITPVVLCGGSGTRLWPLSRKSFPKQFVPLVNGLSLLDGTLARVGRLNPRIVIVASEAHRFMVADSLREAKLTGEIFLEPEGRNTAAAMAMAALRHDDVKDGLMLFCPADHYVPDAEAFVATVLNGVSAALAGAIVTFGVVPTFPSTAYGYIEQGEARADGSRHVAHFIEKPDSSTAHSLLLGSDVLWNAGIFLCSAKTVLGALEAHAPDILAACAAALRDATSESPAPGYAFVRPGTDAFVACRSQSIDYAVLEPFDNVAVIPFEGRWSDVGSWNAVADLQSPDENDNRVVGHGFTESAKNTFVHALHRPVVALGTQNLLIIDTPDAVLVADRDRAEQVKDLVARLEAENCAQAVMHRKVARPWGWYDSVDTGDRFQVKHICVKPGASLSLQKHHHRAEHWIVVTGTAEVTCGDRTFLLCENQSTYIPIGEIHRLRNPGVVELELIEIQSGSYLGEDDIVRLEDTYGRVTQ